MYTYICMVFLHFQGSVTHELDTQGVVLWAEYCAVNNHVATIEDRILYVYQLWWLPDLKVKALGIADCAAWCSSSGRLAVSDGHLVIVYEDLLPLFEFTNLTGIKDIALCENVLALQTSTHVLVVNLHEEKYPTPDNEVIWNFDQEDLIINADELASPIKIDKAAMQSEIPKDLKETYLPDRPIYGLNIKVKHLCNDRVYQPKVLLLKRMQPTFMSLIAYRSCVKQPIPNPLAPITGKLDYVNLIVADQINCELFCVQGAYGRGSVSFTERAESIAVDECFMHVLKTGSLETYALPLPGLSSNWVPYRLSQHRMNMKNLLMSRDHLVVLSSREMGDMTVYSLLKPTTSEFFDDVRTSRAGPTLERAKNIVRLQFRIHGESCSRRLLALYEDIEKSQLAMTVEDLLHGNVEAQKLSDIMAKTDISLILKKGLLTDLGEKLLNLHPEIFEVILAKSNYISPKVLRVQIAKANPKMAVLIAQYVCSHLGRIEGTKLHRKLLQNSVPLWAYEVHPFNGSTPEIHCRGSSPCNCLRCSGGLLYAAVVVSSAPIDIRFTHILPTILEEAPDILKLACMLPMGKSSAANPADYATVTENIIKTVRPYTRKNEPVTPHLLTVLSDVLTLADFLKCIPEGSPALMPWVQNGLMRQKAQKLKLEIVKFGEDELRPLIP